jgi:hypothetical protein
LGEWFRIDFACFKFLADRDTLQSKEMNIFVFLGFHWLLVSWQKVFMPIGWFVDLTKRIQLPGCAGQCCAPILFIGLDKACLFL